jgi:hypothetical protein
MAILNMQLWFMFYNTDKRWERVSMGFKRRKANESRSVYVAARISEQSKHYLDVLSLLHQESSSSIIERGIAAIARERAEIGGSVVPDGVEEIEVEETHYGDEADKDVQREPTYKTVELDKVIHVAEESWSPREWLRHLKMFLISPTLLTAPERIFWSSIRPKNTPGIFWTVCSPENLAALSENDREDFGPHVLKLGVPVQDQIEAAWKAWCDRPRETSTKV